MGEHFTLTRPVEAELAHAARVSTLGELTASIAHDVKQPLAAVVTYGEAGLRWLQGDVPDLAEATNAMQHMIANGRRASDVIARLDALARRTDPQRAVLSIDEIIDDVVMLVQPELSLRHMTLRVERDPSSPSIYGDRIQLQQALINLVMNGIQSSEAMPQRPQELRIISGVRKEAGRKPSATIAVRDFGVGLSQDVATKVFDAFYTTKSCGMGMGLSICRSIIEAHGGSISIVQPTGPGVNFVIELPLAEEIAV